MADRFYMDGPLTLGECVLEGAEAHHLIHVRRFQIGERVTLFNGDGNRYLAEITDLAKKRVSLAVLSQEPSDSELPFRLMIASALPKGDRFDFLLEKLTELGVTDFIPLQTLQSVVIPKSEKREKWQRAVIEASKQCGRDRLMTVHEPCSFTELLKRSDLPSSKVIAHPSGGSLEQFPKGDMLFVIGPEGGFADSEIELATQNEFKLVHLGSRILRIETAGIALAARWMLQS